ncbi:MAG TPA: 50S ribosomal protein L29 [Candidatus Saccharimonadales bacterium]|nr:50S ribosomal protein L29 [Candidatus Saccharimonadales bacterium]
MAKRLEQLREIKGLPLNQISGRITEAQKKLTVLRQDKLLGKLKNPKEIGELKKTIARLKTILDEKVTAQIQEKTHA